MENANFTDQEHEEIVTGLIDSDGPKNLRKAGPVQHARLKQRVF